MATGQEPLVSRAYLLERTDAATQSGMRTR